MDGDFRSQTAWMPSWLRPDRLEIPIYILLVKSDFERRLETIGYALPPAPSPHSAPRRCCLPHPSLSSPCCNRRHPLSAFCPCAWESIQGSHIRAKGQTIAYDAATTYTQIKLLRRKSSRTISRVMSSNDHLSRTAVTDSLKRPT